MRVRKTVSTLGCEGGVDNRIPNFLRIMRICLWKNFKMRLRINNLYTINRKRSVRISGRKVNYKKGAAKALFESRARRVEGSSENEKIFLCFCLHVPKGGRAFCHFIVTQKNCIQHTETIRLSEMSLQRGGTKIHVGGNTGTGEVHLEG